MSRYSKLGKVAKCGSVDSKYFNNTNQFEKDIQDKLDKSKEFKDSIRSLILDNPSILEQRYYEVLEVMLDIRKEYIE